MNRKTRYFLIGSGLVVVVGLGAGLVAYYAGQLPGQPAGPPELAYLPAETTVVAYADVHDIMESEFRERLNSFLPSGSERNRLLEETGIDIERDIDTVVAALASAAVAGSGAVVLLRGSFDASRIEALATEHGASARDYAGTRILAGPEFGASAGTGDADSSAGASRPTPAIAFLEADLLALGPVDSLERAVDARSSRQDVTRNAGLMGLLSEIDQTGNAWIVGSFDTLSEAPNIPDEVRSRLPGVEWFAVSANVDRGLNGFVRADTVDDEAAENLREVIAGALAAARLVGGQNPSVNMALESLQPTGEGRTVQLSFSVEPELLDLMRRMAPDRERSDDEDASADQAPPDSADP